MMKSKLNSVEGDLLIQCLVVLESVFSGQPIMCLSWCRGFIYMIMVIVLTLIWPAAAIYDSLVNSYPPSNLM